MNVVFQTNLDWYKSVAWPVIDFVPQVGTSVFVHPGSESFCKANNIPMKLKVVGVFIHCDKVVCDLWYNTEIINMESDERVRHLMCQ